MQNESLLRGTLLILAFTLMLGLSACNTPADAGTTKPHNIVNHSAQMDAGGNPSGTTPAGPAGSH